MLLFLIYNDSLSGIGPTKVEMATEFLNTVHVRPCFFLYHRVRPSVSVSFLGWRIRISVIQTAKIPKIGKIGAKIWASVY